MSSVYEIITDRIVKMLESGTVPWRKQWSSPNDRPRNLLTLKPYRGVNVWLTAPQPYEHQLWATFKQVQSLGGHVRKGQKSTPIVFWCFLDGQDKDTGEDKKIPLLRFYSVFNVAQCDGIPEKHIPKFPPRNPNYRPIEGAQRIVDEMPQRPVIEHGHGAACYVPSHDMVRMPSPERFDDAESYHSVLFHELIHSTGHQSRLKREGITATAQFGSQTYGREELIAELGAAFLCGQCGIEQATIENSAAYLAGWIKAIKGDARLIVTAAAQAQRAADFILNNTNTTEA